MIRSVIGDEKAQDFMTLIESGLFVKPILVLTSLYVKDKDNFLIVKDWYFLPRKNKYLTRLNLGAWEVLVLAPFDIDSPL